MTDHNRNVTEAYDLVPPVEPFALNAGGVNNIARGIRTGAGGFVLKAYRTQDDVAAIEYEHRLLGWLARAGLPFAVPAPMPARDGSTIRGSADGWLALFPLLPGTQGDAGEPAHVAAAGRALGSLHRALGRYPADPRPGVAPFGDLDHIHPLVPEPLDLFSGLDGHRPRSRGPMSVWWRAEVNALRALVEDGYAALPRQVIHGDFVLGNILFASGDLTAVLDWEFAVLDVRAMDIAAPLISLLYDGGAAGFAPGARLLGRGYRDHIQLTSGEVEALPLLIRLWHAVNLIWRAGQDIAAGSRRPIQPDRLLRARRTARWLERHPGAVTGAFPA